MNDFLMSFRAFLTPINLAEMLAFRLSYGFLNKSEAIKLRTFVVLRQWICHYYEIDFGDDDVKQPIIIAIHRIQSSKLELSLPDQQILGKLRKFINREELAPEELSALTSRDSASIVSAQRRRPAESMSSFDTMNNQSWVRKLGRRIRAVLHGNNNDDAMEDSYSLMAPSVETGQFSWFDGGSPTTYPWAKEDPSIKYEKHSCVAIEYTGVMAEHLCLIESKWFHSVSWTELLSYPQTEVSGHLMACIEHFNQMCQWMISEILRAPSHNEQALIIQKLIRISLVLLVDHRL